MTQEYETKVSVLDSNMISIFAGKDIVHPYRFQNTVRFEVPFTEYTSFVEFLVKAEVQGILYFQLKVYRDCLDKRNIDLLRKYYLIDLSVAVNNEVALSNAFGYQATQITHKFDDMNIADCTYTDIITRLGEMPRDIVLDVRRNLAGCSPRKMNMQELSTHNKMCYCYAVYLWSSAKSIHKDGYINMK